MFRWLESKIEKALMNWVRSDATEPDKCDHEWWVYSTASQPRPCLEVQCYSCMSVGSVDDPSEAEWSRAYSAPSKSYRWKEPERVSIGNQWFPGV
ncbi:MAG: hypothetical protein IPK75_07615 [Acidobacteria bacterium]|nr:hypothetical protein [Acidobacteriota bacterium]